MLHSKHTQQSRHVLGLFCLTLTDTHTHTHTHKYTAWKSANLSVEKGNYVPTIFTTFSCHAAKKRGLLLVSFHRQTITHAHTHTRLGINTHMQSHIQKFSHTYCICLRRLIYTLAHIHVHRRKIGCALFQSQSTFIRAVNVNW